MKASLLSLRALRAKILVFLCTILFTSCGENFHLTGFKISAGVNLPETVNIGTAYFLGGPCEPDGATITLNSPDMNPSSVNATCVNGSYTATQSIQFTGMGSNGTNPVVQVVIDDGRGGDPVTNEDSTVIPADPPIANDDTASDPDFGDPVLISEATLLSNDTPGTGSLDPSTISIVTNTNPATQGTCTVSSSSPYDVTFTPIANFVDSVTCEYQVCNTASVCDSAFITFNPGDGSAPVATNDTASTSPNTPVSIDVSTNDSDPDGNLSPASVALIGAQPNPSTEGSCDDSSAPNITFNPISTFTGTATCTYQICDLNLNTPQCDTASVAFTVNAPPSATNDTASDPDFGDPVVISEATIMTNDTAGSGTLVASTISIDTNANPTTEGTCAVNGSSPYDITFTPIANFVDTATCTYEICNSNGLCDTANITFDPANGSAPVATNDTGSGNPNNPITVNVVTNDSDPDGNLNPASVSLTGTQPNPSTEGSCNASGAPNVIFTPVGGFIGTATCEYQVCDSNLNTPQCDTASIAFTINTPPVATDDTASDPDFGDPVVISEATIMTNDVAGSGTLDASTISIDTNANPITEGTCAVNGSSPYDITFTPIANFVDTATCTYEICNSNGLCDTANITFDPANGSAPVATNDTVSGSPGSPIVADVDANDNDPDGNLDLSSINIPSGGNANPTTEGSCVVGAAPGYDITFTPVGGFTGTASCTYEICDTNLNTPQCDTASIAFSTFAPPVATDDSASDPDFGDPVVITQATILTNDTAGDGPLDPSTISISTNANLTTEGSCAVSGSSPYDITFTPIANFVDTATCVYEICDSNSLCDTATITFDPADGSNPVAVNDTATTQPNTAVTVNVFSNDTDPDGNGTLNQASINVTVDANTGTEGTCEVVNAPANEIRFTPVNGFFGTANCTYEVCDSNLNTPQCDTAILAVTINTPPAATDDSASDPDFGDPVVISEATIMTNDTAGSGTLDASTISIDTNANPTTEGTCAVNGSSPYDITFTPIANFVDTATCVYEICNTNSLCDTATITFDPADGGAPVATNDTVSGAPGSPIVADVDANDNDPDGNLDLSSINIPSGGNANPTTEGTCAVGGAPGYDITFTPVSGFTGTASCTYEICDTNLNTPQCDTASIAFSTLTPPTATDDSASDPDFGDPVVIAQATILTNDTAGDGTLDPSTISIDTNANPTTEGTCAVNSSSPYDITFTPIANFVDTATCIYEICDSNSLCDTATITFDPADGGAPVATNDAVSGSPGNPIVADVDANDNDPDGNLDLSSINIPSGGNANPTTEGTCAVGSAPGYDITFTPVGGFAGSASCTYEICDTNLNTPQCDTALVTFSTSTPPIATNDSASDPDFGDPVVITEATILSNDTAGDGSIDPSTISIDTNANPTTEGTCAVNGSSPYDITFTPIANFVDTATCVYEVCDSNSLCDTATITFDPADGSVPVAVNDTATTQPDTAVTVNVFSNDTDPDGNGTLNQASINVTVDANTGTEGTCEVVNAPLNEVRFTPVNGFIGTASCTYEVCDSNLNTPQCDTATLAVTVNTPPTATDDSASDPDFGDPVVISEATIMTNDVAGSGTLDASTISIDTNANPTTEGTCAVNGSSPYDITFTPIANFVDTATCVYEICNTNSLCDTATITFDPADGNAPVANNDSATTSMDTAVTTDVSSNDSDTDGNLNTASVTLTANQPNPTTEGACTVSSPNVTFTPVSGFIGSATCEYQICDNNLNTPQCDTATLTNFVTSPVCNGATQTFAFLGADDTYTPTDNTVTHALVKLWGAGGGYGQQSGATPGVGGYIEAIVPINSSGSYTIKVGEKGIATETYYTYGGGAPGGDSIPSQPMAGAGGGASEFLVGSTRTLVAGGGGGGSAGGYPAEGGPGGGFSGLMGTRETICAYDNIFTSGFPGTQTGPGAGGWGINSIRQGSPGVGSVGGIGGTWAAGAGGGGGGYFGGGGGGNAITSHGCETGGGGGSSYCGSLGGCVTLTGSTGSGAIPNDADSDHPGSAGGRAQHGAIVVVEMCAGHDNPPFAGDDYVDVDLATSITHNVVSNDSDPDADLDSSSLSLTNNAPANEGVCALGSSAGTIDFTVAQGFSGITSCEYEICDSSGTRCDTAKVVFTIESPQCTKFFASDAYTGTENSDTNAAADDRFGWQVDLDNNQAIVSAFYHDGHASNGGVAYIYDYNNTTKAWEESAELFPADIANSDYFGHGGVAIQNNWAVVTSPGDDDNSTDSGSVYIFQKTNGTWNEFQKLTASDGAAYDYFGGWVSATPEDEQGVKGVALDGEILVVGARGDDDQGSASGSAYVYRFNGNTWLEEAKLTMSDGAASDDFGRSVAVSGNVIAVSAWADDDNGTNSGSVVLYRHNGTNWIEETKLIASDGVASDDFGTSIDLLNNRLVVGARYDDDGGTNSGSAYIFEYDSGSWSEVQKLTALDPASSDYFGSSVALNSNRILIGASYDDDYTTDTGSAYMFVYDTNTSTWVQEYKLDGSGMLGTGSLYATTASDYFGANLVLGEKHALIGIPRDDLGYSNTGGTCGFIINEGPFAPLAKDDFAEAGINLDHTFSVIDNDSDLDFNLDTGSVSIVNNAPASEGNCTLGSTTGTIDFSPANGFAGQTSCEYEICDTTSPTPLCSTAVAYIEVEACSAKTIAFRFTGSDQNYIPTNATVTHARFKAWGAGGGGDRTGTWPDSGGAGAFASGVIDLSGVANPIIVVGEEGKKDGATNSYGGGGDGIPGVTYGGASGGGLSGLFNGSVTQATALILAGAGGGANSGSHSGEGRGGFGGAPDGGIAGTDPTCPAATGGSLFAGGTAGGIADGLGQNGSALQGGAGGITGSENNGGGGGAGYFGGGGGGAHSNGCGDEGGGAGGSSYIATSVFDAVMMAGNLPSSNGTQALPGNNTDSDYLNYAAYGIGTGGAIREDGGAGLVIVQEFCSGEDTAPFAAKDAVETPPAQAITTVVTANDLDINGDLDLSSLSLVAGNQPNVIDGVCTLGANPGEITFTPTAGFRGTVECGYEICDSSSPTPLCDTNVYEITVVVPACSPILASDGAASDYFGFANDVQGTRAVVGSYQDDDQGSASGSAYVYDYNGYSWTQSQKLIPNDGQATDNFGWDLALSGEWIVVGSPLEDSKGSAAGAAYVFKKDLVNNTWIQHSKIVASDGAANDNFGYSVDISGNRMVIGSIYDDDNSTDSGSAYVYKYNTALGIWEEESKLTPTDGAAYDYFGRDVSIEGVRVVAGAYSDDDNGSASGSAYVFEESGGSWSQTAKLTAGDGAASDNFGWSVALSGNRIVVGSHLDDDTTTNTGSAYVFEESGGSWSQTAKLVASDAAYFDYYGYSVDVRGDHIAVGSYFDDDNGTDTGSVYYYVYDGSNWVETYKLGTDDATASDYLGQDVKIGGDFTFAGVHRDDTRGADSGGACAYDVQSALQQSFALAPVAMNDVSSDAMNTTQNVDVIANDTDADFDIDRSSLSIAVNSNTFTEGSCAVVNAPLSEIQFTPVSNFVGSTSCSYVVCDNSNPTPLCDSADLNITVTGQAPVAVDDSISTPLDTPVVASVLNNDSDPDGNLDATTLNITSNANTGTEGSCTVTGAPLSEITFTPVTSYTGTASCTYEVCDASTPTALCHSATLTVNVTNAGNPPVATNESVTGSSFGETLIANDVTSNDTDADGNLDSSSVTISQNADPATEGTCSVSSPRVTFEPTENFAGTATCTYQVCDLTGFCDTADISFITDPGANPSANDDAFSVIAPNSVSIDVSANDTDSDNNLDNSSVTLLSNANPTTEGTCTVNSPFVTFTPVVGFSGSTTCSYEICDQNIPTAQCDSATINIDVHATCGASTYVYNYEGSDQHYPFNSYPDQNGDKTALGGSIDPAVTHIQIKAWGAGGGGDDGGYNSGGHGGAGGYSSAIFDSSASSAYTIVVGEGPHGAYPGTTTPTYGFGGADDPSGTGTYVGDGAGGGLSGLFTGSSSVTKTDSARALIIAGGGAGGGGCLGCGTGRFTGGNGNAPDAGGLNDFLGFIFPGPPGDSSSYGNGGGGFTGGIQANTFTAVGGSGFIHSSAIAPTLLYSEYTDELYDSSDAPNSSDSDYITGIGKGGIGQGFQKGGDGLVVIHEFCAGNNNAPFASNDQSTVDNLSTAIIDVTNNDFDIDGDLDLNTLSITVDAPSAEGSCSIDSNGLVNFTPVNTFVGTTSCTYEICDNNSNCSTAELSISVEAPTNASCEIFTPNDFAASDYFGQQIAIDGNRAVVGAFADDDNGIDSGSAYVFEFDGSNWNQTAKLIPSDGAAYDYFSHGGIALDGNRIAIAAPGDDDQGSLSGSVYIFEHDGSVWNEVQKITASDGAANDYFGGYVSATPWDEMLSKGVALDGDTLVIGAYGDDDNSTDSGSVYVFEHDGTSFVEEQKLTQSDGVASDWFGRSVVVQGDYIFVASPYDDDNSTNSGSVIVFSWNGTTWLEDSKILPSDGAAYDYFGGSLDVSGNRLAVGAYSDDDLATDSGSVYIFTNNSGSWTETGKLVNTDGVASDWFGRSVDINEDRILVGALNDDDNSTNSGSAYLFEYDSVNQAWLQSEKIDASGGDGNPNNALAYDYFASNVVLNERHAIAGAPLFDYSSTTDTGAACALIVDEGPFAPSAQNDFTEAGINLAHSFDVLDNDLDFDFNINPNSLSIINNAPASEGNCTLGSTAGTIDFNPATGFAGQTSCEYEICDTTSPTPLCSTAVAYIEVEACSAKTIAFRFTGSDQNYIPTNATVTHAYIKAWGAGGGGDDNFTTSLGGGGAMVGGLMPVSVSNSLLFVVGEGGKMNSTSTTYGGGGSGSGTSSNTSLLGASGGGLTGVFTNSSFASSTVNDALLIAAGGGGATSGQNNSQSGAGGIEFGEDAVSDTALPSSGFAWGMGASQQEGGAFNTTSPMLAAGNSGGLFLGGNASISSTSDHGSGGGGSGLYGGGGAGIGIRFDYDSGGGGGSSYINSSLFDVTSEAGSQFNVGNSSDSNYISGAGMGGVSSHGGDGLIVVQEYCSDEDTAPFAAKDAVETPPAQAITTVVTANDLDINGNLNVSSLSLVAGNQPNVIDGVCTLGANPGEITFTPTASFRGTVECGYEVCDSSSPTPLCDTNVYEITVVVPACSPILASDGAASDYFGFANDVQGTRAVVGSYQDDDQGSASGSAYVYDYNGYSWTQSQKLTPNDGEATDNFAWDVALSGDWILSGSPLEDSNGGAAGAAYFFKKDLVNDTWIQHSKIVASDGAASDNFGYSVDISGTRAVIGAYLDDDNGSASGSAYVYKWNNTLGLWQEEAKLTPADGAASDNFGRDVAIEGGRIVVSSHLDDDNGSASGSAYVFEESGGSWSQTAKLTAGDGAASDHFAWNVALSGNRIVIGAYQDDDNGSSSGGAYVFEESGGSWSQTAKLNASDAAASDFFGYSVDVHGDHIAVGAYQDDDNASNTGSVYYYVYDGSNWVETYKLSAEDPTATDYLGQDVRIGGDFTFAGLHRDDSKGTDAGAACSYDIQSALQQSFALAPMALNDSASGPFGSDLIADVLSNDSDPDFDLVPSSLNIQTNANAGTEGSCTIVNAPLSEIQFSPIAGFAGTADCTYEVCDSSAPVALCDTATVSFTVNSGAAPVATDDTISTPLDTAVTANVLSNDSDADGNLNPVSLNITADANNTTEGSCTVTGAPMSQVTFTPVSGASGAVTCTYEICDSETPNPLCDTADLTVYVAPPGSPPVAVDDSATGTSFGSPVTIADVTGNDTDVDGDINTSSVSITAQANTTSEGSCSVSSPAITFTPVENFAGTATCSYQVCDNSNYCDTAEISFTAPAGSAPSAVNEDVTTIGSNIVGADVLINDSDADGNLDPSSLSISSNANPSTEGTCYFNGSTLIFNPVVGFTGSASCEYQICDLNIPNAQCSTASLNVTSHPVCSGQKIEFAHTGAIQSYSPTDDAVSHFEMKIWGGGGGGAGTTSDSYMGAPGAFIKKTFSRAEGEFSTSSEWGIVVGGGGKFQSTDSVYGFGGQTDGGADGAGGGLSGLFTGTTEITETDFARALLVAGGGGGGGGHYPNPNGRYSRGGGDAAYAGTMPTMRGQDGIDQCGAWYDVGAGGGGYKGGAHSGPPARVETQVGTSGISQCNPESGSSYAHSSMTNAVIETPGDRNTTALNTSDPDWIAFNSYSAGAPGNGDGGHGLVVVNEYCSGNNNAPLANADAVETIQDQSIVANVLINDTDIDGDLDSSSVSILTQAPSSEGVCSLGVQAGEIQFTPAANYLGTSSCEYEVCDLGGNCSSSTITIEVKTNPNVACSKFKASDAEASDYFGLHTDIDGDRAIVSSFSDDDNGSASGSAYIFEFNGTEWIQQAKLTANDGAASDYFGLGGVAIQGDQAFVTAPGDDDNGSLSGSVYVYEWDGSSWNQLQKLTASDGAANDYFGGYISTTPWSGVPLNAIAVNGNNLVIGARGQDDNGSNSGSAYVFQYDGSSWNEFKKLNQSDGAASDYFGQSVAIDGDVILVGSPNDDDNGTDSGSVLVFEWSGSTWLETTKLLPNDGAASDYFGSSLALNNSNIVIGSYGDDDKGSLSGSVYTFGWDGSQWVEVSKLLASDGVASDYFGYSVDVRDNRIIVGAPYDDDNGSNSGSAYIFEYDSVNFVWTQTEKLDASGGVSNPHGAAASDYFGIHVSIGSEHILGGLSHDDDTASNSGAACGIKLQ